MNFNIPSQLSTFVSSGNAIESGRKVIGDYETFLKMLTVQVKNQDPMNPMESTDFATQLATFSGVEQQIYGNRILEAMLSGTSDRDFLEMSRWLGRTVRATAPSYFDGNPIKVYVSPPQIADEAYLIALDERGKELSREVIGVSSGERTWGGLLPSGAEASRGLVYFRVDSYQSGTLISSSQAQVFARVESVERADAGSMLVLEGGVRVGLGSVAMVASGG